jgi:hypothetical protein
LNEAELGTYSRNAVSSRENRGTDSGHGGSRYCSWLICQASSLPSMRAEPLISNPAPEIVLASFSAQLTAVFLQLLVAPSLLRSSLNRFPARLSAIVCGATLDPGGYDVVSFYAYQLGRGALDLIHSTVNAEITYILSFCCTPHIHPLTPLLRR